MPPSIAATPESLGHSQRAPAAAGPIWRRIPAFLGPGWLVAVGYMDPGNWATSLMAGSEYGYRLLWVLMSASLIAMVLQAAAARLGIASGMDLAQACRHHFAPAVSNALWALCELAIVACNVAEVIGMAVGLQLLFGLPLWLGVVVTLLDVVLILGLQRFGFRVLEAAIVAMVAVIALCFAVQIYWLAPSAAAIAAGFVPDRAAGSDPAMLYLAAGIVGATIMPHNLYLHSGLVRAKTGTLPAGDVRSRIGLATLDSTLALVIAFAINASILVLAAAAFYANGVDGAGDIVEAHKLLSPILGTEWAGILFGIALIASGLSASVTGTLAGQMVLEGFLRLRISAALRRFVSRAAAVVPAAAAILWYGDESVSALLVASQVVLSLQLSFAVVPLLLFTTSRRYLGSAAFGGGASALLWLCAGGIVSLNVWMLVRQIAA